MTSLVLRGFDFSLVHLFECATNMSDGLAMMPSPAISSGIEQISLILGLLLGLLFAAYSDALFYR